MMQIKRASEKILNLINNSQRILITSHRDPDGDSIGSQLALDCFLQSFGKPTRIINQGCLPQRYVFLDPQKRIEKSNLDTGEKEINFKPDLAFILECPSLERLGEVEKLVSTESKIVNIDHHPDNERFGMVNYVDLQASAVGEMIYSLLKTYNFHIGPLVANQIYAAILTDTGRFGYANVSARCLTICAELIKLGADPKTLTNRIYFDYSLPFLKLLGTILESAEVKNGGKICSVTIDRSLLSKLGVNHQEIDGLAHYSLFLSGAEIGLLFTEMDERKTKVSLRSQEDFDVSKLAKIFGGGGHKNAAGCTLNYGLEQAKEIIFDEIIKLS